MGESELYTYLLKFTLISLALVAILWGARWYLVHKWRPQRPRPLIKVVERAYLAPGRQGLVVEVGQQRFFVILSDKHSSVTELDPANFASLLEEEAGNVDTV